MSDSEHYPRLSPFRAGLACKCPRCGRGPLYSGFLTVAERCSVCGLDLQEADSGDGPAVFIIFILGILVVPLALLFEAKVAPPMWLHVAILARGHSGHGARPVAAGEGRSDRAPVPPQGERFRHARL